MGVRLFHLQVLLIASATVATVGAQTELPEGTRIPVRVDAEISSASARERDPVKLSVAYDVKVDDHVLIRQGAQVRGTVILAEPRKRLGRSGKLDFTIERVTAVDGTTVPLRYAPFRQVGEGRAGRVGILTAGAAFVFFPAAPFVLLTKGKEAVVPKDGLCEVFADETRLVKVLKGPEVSPP